MQEFLNEIGHLFTQPSAFRSVMILILSFVVAYWISRILARVIVRIAQVVANRGDQETDDQRNLRYRQIETYLSIAVALIRVVVVIVVAYITWRVLSPYAAENQAANSLAAIGAGAFFVVFAGQTLGMILRDIMAGAIMITEGWFHVGDFVKLDPFWEMGGVVERFTLRSTRLRALNGEIIWVNNQYITAARVTPRGLRTISVEIFLRDQQTGEKAVNHLIETMPKGKMMLATPLQITTSDAWNDGIWHMSVTGQTAPGREWLIEDYFVGALKALDENKEDFEKTLSLPPLVHYSDSTADKRFRRAVRVKQQAKPSVHEN